MQDLRMFAAKKIRLDLYADGEVSQVLPLFEIKGDYMGFVTIR